MSRRRRAVEETPSAEALLFDKTIHILHSHLRHELDYFPYGEAARSLSLSLARLLKPRR